MSENVNDDRLLVQRMLAGEERAFVAFFETYFPRVYRFALLSSDAALVVGSSGQGLVSRRQ